MRSYAAQDVISLPTLSAAGAVALGQGLLTAAKAQPALPTLIATRRGALEVAHQALHQAVSHKPPSPVDPSRTRSADIAEDNAWGAFHDWLFGWTKVKQADADAARDMYAALFPTRLKFTKLPYQLEWAEADTRLTRISSAAYEPIIEKLGGKIILQQLRDAHREYGQALGITAEVEDSSTAGVKEPLREFTATLRAYVLAVAAHADPKDEASVALTDALLAPLHRWQSYITVPVTDAQSSAPAGSTPGANKPPATAPGAQTAPVTPAQN